MITAKELAKNLEENRMNEKQNAYEQHKESMVKEHEDRVCQIKKIEAMKYGLHVIDGWIGDSVYKLDSGGPKSTCATDIAQAMIAFNQLCNEEVDRL